MRKDLIGKQFESLRNSDYGAPNKDWAREFRSTLMMQVKNTAASEPRRLALSDYAREIAEFIFPGEKLAFASRTFAVLTLAVGIVFGGSITTVSAALNSIPGDFLYPLKRMTEGAQMRMASGNIAKAELHVEFAGRRIQEVAKINKVGVSDNKKRMAVAMQGFKQEMNTVNQFLEKSRPEVAAQIAKIVDAKSEEHEQILNKVGKELLDAESKGMVQEAKTVVEDAGVKAIEVIIVTHSSASSTVSNEDVKNTVENKINDIQKRVEELSVIVSAATSTFLNTAEAETAINEAKALNSSGDFASALSKIKESAELVRTATNIAASAVKVISSSTHGEATSSGDFQAQSIQNPTSTILEIQAIDVRPADESSTTPRIIQP